MKTIEITLYKFNELSTEAQETAINKWRTDQWANGDYLYFFADNCKEYCAERGFKNAKIQYSLSSSQGDGLSFSADIDLERFIKECKPDIKQSVLDTILNNCFACCEGNTGNYCFARPDDVSFYLDINSYKEYDRLTAYVTDIKVYIQDTYMQICGTLEANGYAEIEHEDSNEYIRETIEANDYDFTIEGEIY